MSESDRKRNGGKRPGAGRPPGALNKETSIARQKLADAELSAENTVEAIRRGAFPDIGALFDKGGNLRAMHELTEEQRWNIAGLEVIIKNAQAGDGHTDTIYKIKWANRAQYVEMAAKVHGLLHEKLDINVTELGAKLDAARLAAAKRNKEAKK